MKTGKLLGTFNLPVTIQATDCLRWSADGQLAIATKKGVLVYEITPDAACSSKSINFIKTFVENEVSGPDSWQLENVLTEEEVAQLPRALRSEVTLDRLVSPHLTTGDTLFRQPARVGWAPASQPGDKSCLMVLSVDRRLRILRQRGRRWETVVDISRVLCDHLKSPSLAARPPSESVETVRSVQSRSYRQATSCWCWAGVSLLVTGQHSGHLILLSLATNTPTVSQVHSSQLTELSSLTHCQLGGLDLLLVGGGDGRVELISLEDERLSSLGLLWADPDRLKVNMIQVTPPTGNTATVILAKMNFCVFLKMKITGGSRVEYGKPSHINTGMTAIVGLEIVRDRLILSSQKSGIKMVDLRAVGKGVETVSLDTVREHYFCHGMSVSRNQTIFACLDNIATFHDHLILREPARLLLWTLETEDTLRQALTGRSSAGEDWALCPDLLESYRLLLSPDSSLAEEDLQLRHWHARLVLGRSEAGNSQAEQREVTDCEARLRSEAARRLLKEETEERQRYFSAQFLSQHSQEGDRLTSSDCWWRCRICGAGVDLSASEVSVVRCEAGHAWPRCVSSQRPVDIFSPYRCGWCKSLSLSPGRCSLCRGPLTTVGQKMS